MRHFTTQEIDYILKDVPNLFPSFLTPEQKNSYISNILSQMRQSLKKEEIHEKFQDFDSLKKEVESHVIQSIIEPGEGVGVICAQSIGERQTQLCVSHDEDVLMYIKDKIVLKSIGKFIDHIMSIEIPEKKKKIRSSEFLNTMDLNIKVPFVDQDGVVKMIELIEVSRHKHIGNLIKITTETGRQATTTQSHAHLHLLDHKLLPIKASDLKIGDKVPVLKKRNWSIPLIKNISHEHITSLRLNRFGFVFNMETKKIMNHDDLDVFGDVFMDRITHIETITDYKHEYVYDFSVRGNQTFMLSNGLFLHNTLNSFHQSGLSIATVVTGVPRFLELLNATKEPKMSSNSFKLNQKVRTPKEIRKIINNCLVQHTLNDLVLGEKIYPEQKEEEFWFGAYEIVYSNQFRDYKSCITILLDTEKMFKYKIDMVLIKNRIEGSFSDVCCVISPLYIGQIDVFIDTSEIKIPDELMEYFDKKNHVDIYLQEIVKMKLFDIEICGLKNIKNYHYTFENDAWTIFTEGSNFIDLASIPFVDITTLTSNNMWDIYNTIGIEATREFLIEEFTSVVSSDGTFINPSHILLLVDIMTYQGFITSINRYGMKKDQIGVLSRASFEESLDQFCDAGFYSEKDLIKSVSANIMCGKRSIIGSGLCNLTMDWDMIEN